MATSFFAAFKTMAVMRPICVQTALNSSRTISRLHRLQNRSQADKRRSVRPFEAVPLVSLSLSTECGWGGICQNLRLGPIHHIHRAATFLAPEAGIHAPANHQHTLGFDGDLYPLMSRVRLHSPLPGSQTRATVQPE